MGPIAIAQCISRAPTTPESLSSACHSLSSLRKASSLALIECEDIYCTKSHVDVHKKGKGGEEEMGEDREGRTVK